MKTTAYKIFLLLLLTANVSLSRSQSVQVVDTLGRVEGKILDSDGSPIPGTLIRVMTASDSIVKNATTTDSLGFYRVRRLPAGNYVLCSTMLGFRPEFTDFSVSKAQPVSVLPDVRLESSDVVLNAAVVTASLPPVTVIEDTVAYNADAYHAPEGSMVEDLIERIPGAEITDNGKIKINGKEYNKILVNGKEFFGNDPQSILKNLPANIIKRIKTYDRKSEQARLTGIDDGEENNVIDLEIKPNMFKGWVGRVSGATGNHDRYSSALNLNKFRSDRHFALVGGMNNVNNPAFSERGRDAVNYSRAGRPGLTDSKGFGLTYALEKRKKYKVSGNVRYNYSEGENMNSRHSETVYNDSNYRYNDNENHSMRMRNEINANLNLEWKPDSLTTLQLRPNFSYNVTDNWSTGISLSRRWDGDIQSDTVRINRRDNRNTSKSEGSEEDVDFSVFRRLSRKGRNISFNASFKYSDNSSNNYSRSRMIYDLKPKQNRNFGRFSEGDRYNMGYNIGVSYNEPLFKNTHLQFRYRYNYSRSRSDRYGYEYKYAKKDSFVYLPDEVDWAQLPVDTALSSCNKNTYVSHNFDINMRHNLPKMNLSYGLNLNPRHNESDYLFGPKMDRGLVKQDLLNWSPNLSFKYRFTKHINLNLNYSGNSDEPNIDELQEVIDKTNPQNVRYGNPALKPSFTNNFRASFNLYGAQTHQSLVTNLSFSTSDNNTSNMTLSESSTGVRVSKLMNVDGRWSLGGNVNFNTPIDSLERLSLSTQFSANYNENENYNSTPLTSADLQNAGVTVDFQDIQPQDIDRLEYLALKNHTQTLRLGQSLSLRYRISDYLFKLGGGVNYYKVENSIQTAYKRETFDYHLNANIQFDLPFDFQLESGINFTSRHGYSENIQKNIAIWNAQLAKRFLKHNAGLLSFQIFDLLHQRSNITRDIQNLTITDTRSQVLRSYFLFAFQYRINTMVKRNRKTSSSQNSYRSTNNTDRPTNNKRSASNVNSSGSRNVKH